MQVADMMPPPQVYSALNPINGQPFILGLDDYGKELSSRQHVKDAALSRAWTVITLEAQEKQVVTTAMTCPYPGLGYSTDVRPSPDGSCGGSLGYTCKGTDAFFGNCCGAQGLCGWTDDECSDVLGW